MSSQLGHESSVSSPLSYKTDSNAFTREYAESLDAQDPLRDFRKEFIIPSKVDLKRKTLAIDDSCTCRSVIIILSWCH